MKTRTLLTIGLMVSLSPLSFSSSPSERSNDRQGNRVERRDDRQGNRGERQENRQGNRQERQDRR